MRRWTMPALAAGALLCGMSGLAHAQDTGTAAPAAGNAAAEPDDEAPVADDEAADAEAAPPAAPAAAAPAAPAADNRDEDEDDPSKFFWFHRAGVTADIARADIEYCLAQTSTIQARRNPSSGAGGLIGALVEGVIHGIMEGVETRRMHDAGMRKCMGLYGYERYQVPEPQWNAMMRADNAVDQLTAFTSGPAPATERLPR